MANKVDQELVDLVPVSPDHCMRPLLQGKRDAYGERRHGMNSVMEIDRGQSWLWQSGQTRIGRHESRERFRSRANDGQSLPHVRQQRLRRISLPLSLQAGFEALRNRLNRRQGVVQFVAENAEQALPSFPLFFSQGSAEIAEHDQVVRGTVLPE